MQSCTINIRKFPFFCTIHSSTTNYVSSVYDEVSSDVLGRSNSCQHHLKAKKFTTIVSGKDFNPNSSQTPLNCTKTLQQKVKHSTLLHEQILVERRTYRHNNNKLSSCRPDTRSPCLLPCSFCSKTTNEIT